jgi:hypothetical protein
LPATRQKAGGVVGNLEGYHAFVRRYSRLIKQRHRRFGVGDEFGMRECVADEIFSRCVASNLASRHCVLRSALAGSPVATDHVFGLCHFLGFRFALRINDLRDRKLYAIEKSGTYPLLALRERGILPVGTDTRLPAASRDHQASPAGHRHPLGELRRIASGRFGSRTRASIEICFSGST